MDVLFVWLCFVKGIGCQGYGWLRGKRKRWLVEREEEKKEEEYGWKSGAWALSRQPAPVAALVEVTDSYIGAMLFALTLSLIL